jgi:hypothetical protein
MTEKETQNTEFDLQSFRGSSNLRRLLDNEYKDKPVIIQFECGDFIKKAIGCLNIVSCDFVELTGFKGCKIPIEIICPECETIEEADAFRLAIPFDRICSIGLLSPSGPCPPKDPKRPFVENK